jgi:hypothetical protein
MAQEPGREKRGARRMKLHIMMHCRRTALAPSRLSSAGRRLKLGLAACLLAAAASVLAQDGPAPAHAPIVLAEAQELLTSHGLLAKLQEFMRQRNVNADDLDADEMVVLMMDWFRFAPIDAIGGAPSADALVFRYGGWSEGCATGFKLSLLRQVTAKGASDGDAGLLAGITLIFEPSGQAEWVPYSTVSSDWKSIDAFLQAVEASPALRALGEAKPMSVMIESGALR